MGMGKELSLQLVVNTSTGRREGERGEIVLIHIVSAKHIAKQAA